MTVSRDFKGIWIPREIWLHLDLTITDKALWAEIHHLNDRERGGCWASNKHLAGFLGLKERQTRGIISKLEKLGLMEQISFNGRIRIIRAIVPPDDPVSKDSTLPIAGQSGNGLPGSEAVDCQSHRQQIATKSSSSSKKNKEEKKSIPPGAVALELSALLLQNLRNLNPGFKEPDLQAWGRDMDLLMRIDKRDPEEIRKLVAWIAKDPFWQKVVLSAAKLRRQFDAIWMKARLPKSNLEANKRLASDLKAERIEAEYLEIKADHVLDARLGKDLMYTNPNFAEILCGWYRLRVKDE